jgi:spore coat polysaccharide biosynthesis protein SpsF
MELFYMSIVCIIQARMASTRLPGKTILRLPSGDTVIERVIKNAKKIPFVDAVAVAMPFGEKSTELARICNENTDHVYYGSATDLMDRYWDCCRMLFDHGSPPTSIIRVTADDLYRDANLEQIVGRLAKKNDYVYTSGYPEGINSEAFSIDALAYGMKHATEREHLTYHFLKNTSEFMKTEVKCPHDWSKYRVTLDTEEDWKLICEIDKAGCKNTEEIVKFLEGRK